MKEEDIVVYGFLGGIVLLIFTSVLVGFFLPSKPGYLHVNCKDFEENSTEWKRYCAVKNPAITYDGSYNDAPGNVRYLPLHPPLNIFILTLSDRLKDYTFLIFILAILGSFILIFYITKT